MMQKILISYGTRPLAQRVANLVKGKFEVLYASSEPVPSVLESKYNRIPNGSIPTYSHELLKLCLDKQVDYLLPLGLQEVESLSVAKLLFHEYGIQVLCPSTRELEDLFIIHSPAKELELEIVHLGKDLITDQLTEYEGSGLTSISDNGDSIALCVI